jgi:hypothetical protein
MRISLSAAFDPNKYYWMRLGATHKTVTDINNVKHTLGAKCLFGVREVRGKDYDEVVTADNSERFKLTIRRSEALMNSAKEFKGDTSRFGQSNYDSRTITSKVVKPSKKVVVALPAAKIKPVKKKLLKPIPIALLGEQLRAKKAKTATPKVTVDARKAQVANLKQNKHTGNVKIKLSDLELPELDDFTDTSLPDEFKRYKVVESTGVCVEKIKVSFADEGENNGRSKV